MFVNSKPLWLILTLHNVLYATSMWEGLSKQFCTVCFHARPLVNLKQSMLHQTAQERYQKLKMVYVRLMQRFNCNDLDDFILTANSLPEWIRQDSTLSIDQKEALEKFVVPESLDWQICHQIANAQKHARAKTRFKGHPAPPVVVKSVNCQPGGTGFAVPSSMRVVGAGDEL